MKIKQKLNENGFAHLSLIIIIVLSLAVVGLAGYRVNEARKANSAKQAESADQQKSEIQDTSSKQEELAEETLPAEQSSQPVEQKQTQTKAQTEPKKDTAASTPTASSPREIYFVKGGQSTDGDYVELTHVMTEAHSGTCKFTFSLNGTVRVQKTVQISNSKACTIDIPKSEFPKSAEYMESTRFDNSDGSVFAETQPYGIEVL